MLLHELNKEEKIAFLELAHLVAMSNGIIDEKEKIMLDTYKKEMGLGDSYELKDLQLEEIVQCFIHNRSKRIAFLESISVAFADGVYQEEQKNLIAELRQAFDISLEDYENFKAWIIKVNALHIQANEMVGA
ncbi:hypothetical protein [Sutcliffiella horikoshii]|uniref:hypothetical protein n=1 Tax=Sutcliffiella horikoshii TaxID=79883 RepID=UPI00384D0FA6